MAYLETSTGSAAKRTIPLTSKRCLLGRQSDCDVVVDADSVSRHHARILLVGRDYYVEDLNSSNGTEVNNRLIQSRVRLQEGDSIRMSQFEFLFHESLSPLDRDQSEHLLPDQRSIIDEDAFEGPADDTATYLKVASPSSSDTGLHTTSTDPRFDAFIEVTQSLGQFLSLDKLLPRVLDSLFKMLPQSHRGCVILKDAQGELRPGWVKIRKGELRVSRAVVNKVMESGDAIVTSNASTDARFSTNQSNSDFRLKSIMCAPLIDREGNSMGVLQLDTSNGRRAFGQEDLKLLVAMATQTSLAISVAKMHEAELRARTMERDLMLAAEVQRNSLPELRPSVPGYDFFDYYEPAEQVGGDFFDYIPLSDGRLGVVIGDVVGHGIPAALVMSKVLAETRFLAASLQDPATVLDMLNGMTCRSTRLGRFITLVMIVLEPRTHIVTLASAGHVPPQLRRADRTIRLPGREVFGPPLGTSKDTIYQSHSFQMEAGELLFLQTDGMSEAENGAGESFGERRVAELLRHGSLPTDVVTSVICELDHFLENTRRQDDLCIVCFGRR
ncbi:MAG: SpoIIE family protein phosphatase [Planctomycetaceae bacterium]|nr:SpoIIE family protein phosphatase [Planctomycetales bacterium]MCB9926833.1 SpoIIE family protein phosphatase [Planctomycetaceae bacterium]